MLGSMKVIEECNAKNAQFGIIISLELIRQNFLWNVCVFEWVS